MKPTKTNTDDKKKLSQLMDGEWHDIDPADCVAALCADDELHAKWSRYHIIRDVLKNEPVKPDADIAARICSAIKDEASYSNITPFSGGAVAPKSGAPTVEEILPEPRKAVAASAAGARLQVQDDVLSLDRPSWVNTGAAGFAVAASVALVTVVGLNLSKQQVQPTAVLQTVATAVDTPDTQLVDQANRPDLADSVSLPVVDFVANTGSFWMSPESSTRVTDENRLNIMLSHHIGNSPTAGREGLLPYSRLVGYETVGQSEESAQAQSGQR